MYEINKSFQFEPPAHTFHSSSIYTSHHITYLRASLSALMAAFSSSVFSTTSLSSVDIHRCVAVAVVVLVAVEDVRRLRRIVVVVVVARGAHATATLRAVACRRNRAATILQILVENMCDNYTLVRPDGSVFFFFFFYSTAIRPPATK
jgi:hypothetical protein